MNHYTDISILPDPEFPATVLMNSLYTKLHRVLCDLNSTRIGVSFPQHKIMLGNVLRIHGAVDDLTELQQKDWLGGMAGYCQVSSIGDVPTGVKHRVIRRKQATMSHSKLNRLLKRGSITQDEITQYKARMFANGLDEPYIELQSGSNGRRHRRYIDLGPLLDKPVAGVFDQFGLSKTGTVPWF